MTHKKGAICSNNTPGALYMFRYPFLSDSFEMTNGFKQFHIVSDVATSALGNLKLEDKFYVISSKNVYSVSRCVYE